MTSPDDSAAFRAELEARERAAKGLQEDLLTEVPMLYGSPSMKANSVDPGITIAAIHREEMVRRNGGGLPPSSTRPSVARLPFERTLLGLAVIYVLIRFFG